MFTLAGLFAFLFVVVYVGSGWFLPDWHWEVTESGWSAFFTPLLGLFMGLSLLCVGVGLVLFTKKLLPHETAVQDKHDGSHFDRVTSGATLVGGLPQQRPGPPQADHPVPAASWAAASG